MALTRSQRRANINRALSRVRSSRGGVTGYARGGAKVTNYVNVTYTDPQTGQVVTRSVSPQEAERIHTQAKLEAKARDKAKAKQLEQQRQEEAKRRAEKQQEEIIKSLLKKQEREATVTRGKQKEIIIQEGKRKQIYVHGGGYADVPTSAKVTPRNIPRPKVSLKEIPKKEEVKKPQGTLTEAEPPKGFIEKGERKRDELYAKRVREGLTVGEKATLFGIGVGASVVSTGKFIQSLVTHPIKTTKETVGVLAEGGKRIITGQGFPEVGVLLKEEPEFVAGFVTGELAQMKVISKGVKTAKETVVKGVTILDPRYSKVSKDVLGRKTIKGVKGTKGPLEIDIVPPGSKPKLTTDLKKAPKVPLKEKPVLPKTTPTQAKVIEAVKETKGSAISGSFAQETLVKGGRGFADIDVVTKDISKTAEAVQKKVGLTSKVQTVKITDSPLGEFEIKRIIEKKTGKVIADIDPLKYSEEGLAVDYGTTTVQGVEMVSPEARLGAKLKQFARGKRTEKVIKDIEILSGGEVSGLRGQSVRGGFGFSFEEQAQVVGKTGDIVTGQRDLFGLFTRREIPLEREFFASPFDVETGKAQLRVSRLGLAQPEKEATLLDLLSGDVSLRGQKPQAVLFQNVKIANIPRELKGVYRKAKAGDTSAQAEFFKKYAKYQEIPTGEFKPFGFPGTEAEVTLAPGEIIKKGKTIGVTLIEGKRVPIIAGEIVQATEETKSLLKKAKTGTISIQETRQLKARLRKETGLQISQAVEQKPILKTEGPISSLSTRAKTKREILESKEPSPKPKTKRVLGTIRPAISSSIIRPKSKPLRAVSKRPTPSPPIQISPTPSRKTSRKGKPSYGSPPPSAPPSAPPSSPPTPPITPPTPPPSIPPGGILLISSKKKKDESYSVEVRKGGIWRELTEEPTSERAFAMGIANVRGTAMASFRVKPVGKPNALKGFAPSPEFRRSKKEEGVYIQRRQFRISSPGEKKDITQKGLLSLRSKSTKKFSAFGG